MKAFSFLTFCILFCLSCVPPSTDSQETTNKDGTPTVQYANLGVPRKNVDRRQPAISEENLPFAKNETVESYSQSMDYTFPYNLMREDEALFLSRELKTIGGLSMSADKQQLVAISGQGNSVYFLDKQTGSIQAEVDLKKMGDFESVEAISDGLFVAKKNGTLVFATDLWNIKPTTKNYNTNLSSRNEVEGLAFDPVNNELLLACKGKAGDGGIMENAKAIYVFQFDKMELLGQPMYMITEQAIADYFDNQSMSERMVNVVAQNYPPEAYAPTSIAIHPHSDEIYWLCGDGNLLIVLNRDNKIKHMEILDSFIFSNAKGMCFDQDGTLYVSNQGKGNEGRIYRFFKKEFQ